MCHVIGHVIGHVILCDWSCDFLGVHQGFCAMCEFHCHLVRIRKSMGVVKPLPIVHNLRGKIEGRGRKGRHARKRERVWWVFGSIYIFLCS